MNFIKKAKKNGLDLDAAIMLEEFGVDSSKVKGPELRRFMRELKESGICVLATDN